MKKLIKNLLLFLIPFMCIGIALLLIDPYDYFGLSIVPGDTLKVECARKVDYSRRQNLVNYRKVPKKNVIIGTSQTRRIEVQNIPSDGWAQLSMGGAGVSDELDMFWWVAERYPLDSVILGFDPWNYARSTGYNSADVTETAFKLIENPARYFVDKIVYHAACEYVKAAIKGEKEVSEAPNQSRDSFWEHELDYVRKCMVQPSESPVVRQRLEEIRDYCTEKGIQLRIIIPVSHTDVFGITQDYYMSYFRPELVDIFGVVYDFMEPNELNGDKENFGDPCHMKGDKVYIDALFRNDLENCKIIKK